jgi:hypothetical protein
MARPFYQASPPAPFVSGADARVPNYSSLHLHNFLVHLALHTINTGNRRGIACLAFFYFTWLFHSSARFSPTNSLGRIFGFQFLFHFALFQMEFLESAYPFFSLSICVGYDLNFKVSAWICIQYWGRSALTCDSHLGCSYHNNVYDEGPTNQRNRCVRI